MGTWDQTLPGDADNYVTYSIGGICPEPTCTDVVYTVVLSS